MSFRINPAIGTEVGFPLSNESFWFKNQELTNHIHTKEDGDKRIFKNASVYTIHNIVKESSYYILVSDRHELLFDTSDYDEMDIHIEKMKTLD